MILRRWSLALVLLSAPLLLSCAGGNVLGVVPAPKAVAGKITDTRYFAPDGSFSCWLPVERGPTLSWGNLKITEGASAASTYVSFNSPNLGREYQVSVIKKDVRGIQQSFIDISTSGIADYKQKLGEAYGGPFTEDASYPDSILGHTAVHWKLTQALPRGAVGGSNSSALYHEGYAIDFQSVVAVVWVQSIADYYKGPMNARAIAESLMVEKFNQH